MLFLVVNLLYRHPLRHTVFTLHNSYQNLRRRNRLLLGPALLFFRRTVCCGHSSLESLPALLKLLGGRRLIAIPNGIDLDRVDGILAGQRPVKAEPDFVVVALGRLIEMKNPLVALSAFQLGARRNGRMVFIGDGHLRKALEAGIREAGLQTRVTLAGLIQREQVYRKLASADVLISTSRGEGLPLAVLEAMACGLPVVLSDIPPHREIVGSADFIPLVPPDDADGFGRAIGRLMDKPPSERRWIGESCRRLVEKRFSLTAMHQDYAETYQKVGRRKGR
jgi:glycosyltransferase involved in cell wall biosynthesis